MYEHPTHTVNERMTQWKNVIAEFSSGVYDYTGLEAVRERGWQSQLHIYEVPFYYIEYGMAQLGAIAVWRNYKKNPEDALNKYEAALRLGYTKSIPEIYKAAGVKFDFSQAYVKELADFVKAELDKL
jgi:oligoendopeptidase F